MSDRLLAPLFDPDESAAPPRATDLRLERVPPSFCRPLIRQWHSRLPDTQIGPWKLGFAGHYEQTAFAVALWHNPSARSLPQDWLELRRMAVANDAPHCTASWMLGAMTRWIRANMPEVSRLVSYQDQEVHSGTIYKAAGWQPAWVTKPRARDRNKGLVKRKSYRTDINGSGPAAAAKTRWEMSL